jgi:glycosyltransferase involved in cell wall biosynthesis
MGNSVSVIIPAFNSGQWIEQALNSVLGQSVRPDQILVVDDGSTDETAQRTGRYGEAVTCIRQSNRGVAAARNRGLREACGDFIAFLDADDVWHPHKLELQLRVMQAHGSVGFLGTRLFNWPVDSPPHLAADASGSVEVIGREKLAVKNCFTTSSVLVRADVVKQVGDFDPALHGPEDHDYWLRASEVTQMAKLTLPLTGYRCIPGSLSKRAESMEAGMRRILRKLDARDFWRGDRLLRRRAYSYVDYSSAYLYGAAGDYPAAIRKLLRSLWHDPRPYRLGESGTPFARPKRLAVLLMRMLGVMSPDPGC